MSFRKNYPNISIPVFLTSFGLTIYFLPVIFRVFTDFSFNLHLRARQEIKAYENNGPIYISNELIQTTNIIGDYPVRIIIPAVNIDLTVEPAKVNDGVWEVHDTKANFGLGSALPENKGNSVIFAHAKDNLFLPLRSVNKNDLISLLTRDGKWFNYQVVEKKEVSPEQIETIRPTFDKTLTLFTCSGFADSQRLIVIAKEKV